MQNSRILPIYNASVAITLSALLYTGQMYSLFAWCEEQVGGWLAPLALSLLLLPIVLHPLIQGLRQGMQARANSTHT